MMYKIYYNIFIILYINHMLLINKYIILLIVYIHIYMGKSRKRFLPVGGGNFYYNNSGLFSKI